MALADVLVELGFVRDKRSLTAAVDIAEASGLSRNGVYEVMDVFVRDDMVVTVEQNQAPSDLGGYTALVTHPPLAIIASSKGRVAFNPKDEVLARNLVAELS